MEQAQTELGEGMKNRKLAAAVRSVLKREAARGVTTKSGASILVMRRIEGLGGPTRFGIGAAAMRLALMNIIGTEVTRQLKTGLSDADADIILPPTLPDEARALLGRLPQWVAIEEGPEAMWIPWRKATRDHWLLNAALKEKKANQTLNRMRFSFDVAEYLEATGLRSLGDLFT